MTVRGTVRAAEPTAAFFSAEKMQDREVQIPPPQPETEKHPLWVLFFLSVGFESSGRRVMSHLGS